MATVLNADLLEEDEFCEYALFVREAGNPIANGFYICAGRFVDVLSSLCFYVTRATQKGLYTLHICFVCTGRTAAICSATCRCDCVVPMLSTFPLVLIGLIGLIGL